MSAKQDLQNLKEYILEHPEESKESADLIYETIQNSPLTYTMASGKVDTTEPLHIPKIFSLEDKKNFQTISKEVHTILSKLIDAYKEDEEVRKVFHFDQDMNDLIYMDAEAPSKLPMLRVDIFYDEDTKDFYFCEFNTDGTSSMFENAQMNQIMEKNNAFKNVNPNVEALELMETWADKFLDIYGRSALKDEKPSILITDFLENAYLPDLKDFERIFRERGVNAEVEDIRNLKYDGDKLVSTKTGTAYNAVYRRATTGDIYDNLDEVQDLLNAIKDHKVVMVGSFQTQVPHSKRINHALLNPASHKYLTEEEVDFINKHVPVTMDLTPDIINLVTQDKDKWIIKPIDGYGSKDVHYGAEFDDEGWKKILESHLDDGFIVQEFIPHYKSENIDLIHNGDFIPYANVTGLYVYDGDFAGVLSRLSDGEIMSSVYNRRMVPTYFEKEEVVEE